MFEIGKKNKNKDKKKVLIVEDDALLSKAVSHMVISSGFDDLIVDNGLKVMDAVKTFKPHIILLDLIIPGLDGFEVLRQLKADALTRDVPVFVVSNLSSVADIKSIKVMGADEYFIKANTDLGSIISAIKKRLK